MMARLTAKRHLELCLLEDQDYSIGRAHCKLAALYSDFDQLLSDITELRFYIKWKRPPEAALVFERIMRSNIDDETWNVIYGLFKNALNGNHVERALFKEISCEAYEIVIGGLTKRFDNDDLLKTNLLLFTLRNCDESKFGKLFNRTIIFLTERASNDKDLLDGIGKYHLYLAVIAVPALLQNNIFNITASRALNVMVTALQVAVAWPFHQSDWCKTIMKLSENYEFDSRSFTIGRFKIVAAFFDKCISHYEFGPSINLTENLGTCGFLRTIVEKANILKNDARKIIFAFFIWFAYSAWSNNMPKDEVLVWIPEDNWLMDVDKLLTDKNECGITAKKPKLRERRELVTASSVENVAIVKKELCDAYELCCATLTLSLDAITDSAIRENLYYAAFYPNLHQFISESLMFKCKYEQAISLMNERLVDAAKDEKIALNLQLACVNCLERNWPVACDNVISVFTEYISLPEFEKRLATNNDPADRCCNTTANSCFEIVKKSRFMKICCDLAYHILFKVYTSTAMDHDNDQLLGALLVLSQIDFAYKGHRCFNRIMRHIEAKGSLKSAGLVKYISNIAILEELSRIQNYCSEYVSIQIAAPQVQRRIGQWTRHSVRGTKDGQKQSLEEQIKKCHETSYDIIASYFVENKQAVLEMLGAK